jgi:tetratricopeptide (TPR) repeat protein
VAGHWQAAGNPAGELPARVAAGNAAERLFGYAEAATHRQRAVELCHAHPDAAAGADIDVPRLYVRAVDALAYSGDKARAGALAEEAYRWFAGHSDPATAAVVRHRAAVSRVLEAPAAGLPLIEEALRLFEQAPPSADHANALFDYGNIFLRYGEERLQDSASALNRALQIAEAADATTLIPRILSAIAYDAFTRGRIEDGFAILARGWALALTSRHAPALA